MLDGHRKVLAAFRFHKGLVSVLELGHFFFFVVESLGDTDAGNRRIDISVDLGDRTSRLAGRLHMFLADDERDQKQQRRAGEDDQRQSQVDTGKIEERKDQ